MNKEKKAFELGGAALWKEMNRVGLKLVEPDRWSEKEITRLSMLLTSLWLKKADELKLKKKLKMKTDIEGEGPDSDDNQVFAFRKLWIAEWSGKCGLLEDVTMILSMPFTYHKAPIGAYPCTTLQLYSVRVVPLYGGLTFPLDVYGMVAIRDFIDHNLNLVFYRSRDNCQTLNEKDQYLELVGPTRAVVLPLHYSVSVEVELKVRGAVESEDRCLSFVAAPVDTYDSFSEIQYRSKQSMLVFSFGTLTSSVEATIFIRAIEGSWPDGAHGKIVALFSPERIAHRPRDINLLMFGPDIVPVSADGKVELSRRVVSVPNHGSLIVCFGAWKDDVRLAWEFLSFTAAKEGRSYATVQFGTCQLEVVVVWSVVSPEPDVTMAWC